MTKETFEKWVHKFGMGSSAILLLLMVAFPFAVSLIYGVWPDFAAITPAIVMIVLILAPYWPGETIGYMTTMGPGALYMSYITGNVTNLRMPATVGTMQSIGLKPNTDECHTMAIIACGASNFVTVGLLAIGLLLSVPLQPILYSETLQPAFNFALPALFGGLVAQGVCKDGKTFGLYLIPLVICVALALTGMSAAYFMLITVAMGAVVYYFLDYKRTKAKEAKLAAAAEAAKQAEQAE